MCLFVEGFGRTVFSVTEKLDRENVSECLITLGPINKTMERDCKELNQAICQLASVNDLCKLAPKL